MERDDEGDQIVEMEGRHHKSIYRYDKDSNLISVKTVMKKDSAATEKD